MPLNNFLELSSLLLLYAPVANSARVTNPQNVPQNAVLLSKVSSLTLRNGRSTSARRGSAIPQLTCVGSPDVCALHAVDMMRCTNEGADYDANNIQWSCKAQLPEEFKLGSTDVSCEGYASADDPYILKGSCGVEYRLLLTDKGEKRYPGLGKGYGWNDDGDSSRLESGTPSTLFLLLWVGVVLFILYKIFSTCRQTPPRTTGPRRRRMPRTGNGGDNHDDGGDDDNNDPPPPYDSHTFAAKRSSTRPSTASSSTSVPQSWRPGFWTGTAAGAAAAAAYAASRSTRGPETRERERERQTGIFNRSAPPSDPYAYAPSAGPSRSHESTGFGETRRR